MKPSKYNHFFPYSETQCIAYNGLSNALALIDKSKFDEFNSFCNNGIPMSEDLNKDLRKGMFLIDDCIDELDVLRYRMFSTRYNSDTLSMTIAPTNDCQFDCIYCYEKDAVSNKYMTVETQDKLVEILESRKGLISHFSVTWYGGEPLMAFDIVESLSKRFIAICKENKIQYHASMISNGYMLDRHILKRMEHLDISVLQITIDGLPELHNKMRPLKGGGDTFETILDNLKNGFDLLPPVSLRINIDKDNTHAGEEIYKLLQKNNMLKKIKPYFGMITNDAGTYSTSQCLSMCDFSEITYDFATRTSDESDSSPVQYPTLKTAVCGADSANNYVVDAEGTLYKCWCDIGRDDRKVGSISSTNISTNNTLFKYLLFDPTTADSCKDCNVLPLCMGGCPYKRMAGNDDKCTNHKYILQKCLSDAISFFQERKNQEKQVSV